MKRRNFLKTTLYTAGLVGLSTSAAFHPLRALAAPAPRRTLIHVLLVGGADLRYLFVPAPSDPTAAKFWQARSNLYQPNAMLRALYPDYPAVWQDLYLQASDSTGNSFGIHKNAGWLKQQYDLGKVAIVANVVGATNRRHDHARLIVNSGDLNARQFNYDRDGWGGRLAEAIGGVNTVAVTQDVSVFCKGSDATNRNRSVIHAKDTRHFALSSGNGVPTSLSTSLGRALKGYYRERGKEAQKMGADWPYQKFFQHEKALRQFGDAFQARLDQVAPSRPRALQALYDSALGTPLHSTYFGRQCASVYDSYVGADILQLGLVSMEYGGWDTHRGQKSGFESNIEDLFGTSGGLAMLMQELAALPGVGEPVFVFETDFGRQLQANGDFGTDHGTGNYMILVGPGVKGGTYGEMFPLREIQGSPAPYDQHGTDIEGRTSFERVLAQVCDWIGPGTGATVFPDTATGLLPIESGVDLSGLML